MASAAMALLHPSEQVSSAEVDMARAALQAHGIDNERLLAELTDDPSEALRQVERLRQEMERGVVANPQGWLVEAIRGRYRVAGSTPAHDDAAPVQHHGPERLAGASADEGPRDDDPAMSSTPEEMAWAMVRAELRAELTPENYQRWFVPTMAVALEDDRLTIGVPDAFHQQWLDRRLRGTIERAARRVLGETVIAFALAGRASA